jgi:hypothetical protein
MARISGEAADDVAARLRGRSGIQLLGPVDGAWLVRAPDHAVLSAALAATPRPPGRRLRIAVDPPRV